MPLGPPGSAGGGPAWRYEVGEQLRPIRQTCPVCNGKGVVLMPRFGMSSDGTAGTVHVEERCRTCVGDGWLDRGRVRAG